VQLYYRLLHRRLFGLNQLPAAPPRNSIRTEHHDRSPNPLARYPRSPPHCLCGPISRLTLKIDFDRYAEHVAWLADEGCDGVSPNGSLGEYSTLTAEERSRVVQTAVAAAPDGFAVMPGVAAYGSQEASRWAADAAEAGCPAVMLLPPNAYRADERAVLEHYRAVAAVGVPVVAYNYPIDTKVDLTPELLAQLHGEGLIVAVKEFSGDVRRLYRIKELAPGLDVLIGADDVVLELAIASAPGWVAGYPNAFPRACVELFSAARTGDLTMALPLYRRLRPLLRWDSRTEFVQASSLWI